MKSIKRVIGQLDIRRAQVLIEAVIAEVSGDLARELGVQWLFAGDRQGGESPVGVINFTNTGRSITSVANAIAGVADGGALPDISGNALLGFGDIDQGNSFNYLAVVNALASDTNSNLLSTPTLVTLDNEEAEIVIGSNVPFVTGSFTPDVGTGGSTANPFQTISREDVGLTLRIKPQINEGDAMRLDIEQEVSSIAPSVAGASDIVTDKRSIKTNVMVDDGQIVVLGGLIEETIGEDVQKVPLLGDIPLLGNLFKSRSADVTRTNLMVFIHPVILRDSAVTSNYTNSKYNYLRSLQMDADEDGVNLMYKKKHPVLPPIEEFSRKPDVPAVPTVPAPEPAPEPQTNLFPDE
ncbi:MAG: hypothetical protein HKP57_09270 [Halobacteria archaeon]|nr:hypothetical protein [Halobacteria archaeon]